MESIDFGRVGVERRRYAVEEIRFSLARLYRGFVLRASTYGEADAREERERREQVDRLLDLFSRCYLPRSMWLAGPTRETIEDFAEKSREMREWLGAEVEAKGYEEVRSVWPGALQRSSAPPASRWTSPSRRSSPGPNPRGGGRPSGRARKSEPFRRRPSPGHARRWL